MGNYLPFLKKSDRRRNEDKPSDQPPLSVEEAHSVTPRAAGPITLEQHTHRPLEQGQLHSSPLITMTASRSSAAESKAISDLDEIKTPLEVTEQPQTQVPLRVEIDVPARGTGPIYVPAATAPGMKPGQRPVAVPGARKDGNRTGHSTRTRGSGNGKTGHSTRTKRKHKTATRKRQHGELRCPCLLKITMMVRYFF